MARADYRPARPVGPNADTPGQGLRWRGAWDTDATYAINDVVFYDPDSTGAVAGGSYVATTAHSPNDPAPITDIGVGDFVEWAVSIGWSQFAAGGAAGPLVTPVVKTANYNAVVGAFVLADTTNGSFTVTLPDAGDSTGQGITIKKIGVGYTLTIASADGMRFDSIQTSALITDYGTSFTFVSDGTYWDVT